MSDPTIPMTPLYDGHSEVYDRYVELRGEEWVERVDRQTSVYEFALCYVDSIRHAEQHDSDEINNDIDDDAEPRPRA